MLSIPIQLTTRTFITQICTLGGLGLQSRAYCIVYASAACFCIVVFKPIAYESRMKTIPHYVGGGGGCVKGGCFFGKVST